MTLGVGVAVGKPTTAGIVGGFQGFIVRLGLIKITAATTPMQAVVKSTRTVRKFHTMADLDRAGCSDSSV
jgi:hypothetical protein